jgi:L-methionine (R)-S-oxide reductase
MKTNIGKEARMLQDVVTSVEQLDHLLDEADGLMTTLANASAFLNELLSDINWVGFYLLQDGALRLCPFQGKPACTRIAVGSGVCGTAIAQNQTQLVEDVHTFPGHIACDSASNSELVVVLRSGSGEPIGVLDIDSPLFSRFTEADAREMERAAEIISFKIRHKY